MEHNDNDIMRDNEENKTMKFKIGELQEDNKALKLKVKGLKKDFKVKDWVSKMTHLAFLRRCVE